VGTPSTGAHDPKPSSADWVRTRESIIRAAADIFRRDGYRAGTTKDIAARVGLSQPAIYYYVGSKEVLLSELAVRLDQDMAATLQRATEHSDQPREQLKTFIRELTRAVMNDTTLFAVYWAESRFLPKAVASQVSADEKRFVRQVEHLVSRVQADGGLPPGPPPVITEGLLGMVLWMYRWYRKSSGLKADDIADLFLRLVGLQD
jgi:TetR/AcrR family transcriptional regulator, cholesterol catabolism regulator